MSANDKLKSSARTMRKAASSFMTAAASKLRNIDGRTVKGMAIGGGGALGAAVLFSAVHSWLYPPIPESSPYIGCDFSDRNEADTRRDFNLLSKDAVRKACAEAVEKYFVMGAGRQSVMIPLPPREKVIAPANGAAPQPPQP